MAVPVSYKVSTRVLEFDGEGNISVVFHSASPVEGYLKYNDKKPFADRPKGQQKPLDAADLKTLYDIHGAPIDRVKKMYADLEVVSESFADVTFQIDANRQLHIGLQSVPTTVVCPVCGSPIAGAKYTLKPKEPNKPCGQVWCGWKPGDKTEVEEELDFSELFA